MEDAKLNRTRRLFMIGGAAALTLPLATSFTACTAQPKQLHTTPSLSVTLDDFNFGDVAQMSAVEKDKAIRGALKAHSIKAAAFPTGQNGETKAVRKALSLWAQEGHMIGNHSYSHPHFDNQDPVRVVQEFIRAEAILSEHSTYEKFIRFPYLEEGETEFARDEVRRLLKDYGYRNAHVTIGSSDWYTAGRMRDKMTTNPNTDLSAYKQFYLDYFWSCAEFYNDLGQRLTGRNNLNHTLLIHHNIVNALFLDDLLTLVKKKGWRLIDAKESYNDPLFDRVPNALPAGNSFISALAQTSGTFKGTELYPKAYGQFGADGLDALGL